MNFSDDEYSDLSDLPKLRGRRVQGAGRSNRSNRKGPRGARWELPGRLGRIAQEKVLRLRGTSSCSGKC